MSLCYDFEKWTIISLLSVTISLTVGLIILLSEANGLADNVGAQPVEFKNYTNNDLNFTIQYPSNWIVRENDLKGGVGFRSSEYQGLPIFSIFIDKENETQFLDTNTLTLKNMSLAQYVNKTTKELKKAAATAALPVDYKLIRQYEVTLYGNKGIKQEWTVDDGYLYRINVIVNGKYYELTYLDKQLKVPETLPLANKLVDSFRVGVIK